MTADKGENENARTLPNDTHVAKLLGEVRLRLEIRLAKEKKKNRRVTVSPTAAIVHQLAPAPETGLNKVYVIYRCATQHQVPPPAPTKTTRTAA